MTSVTTGWGRSFVIFEASHPLEVMDDVRGVSVIKVGHRDIDELHLLLLQHLDPLLQLPQVVLVWQLHLHLQTSFSQLINWSG